MSVRIIATVGLVSVLWGGAASAASIGVNFVGGQGPGDGQTRTLAPSDVAGVVPQGNWVNVTGSSGTNVALTDDTGTPVGTTLTFNAGTGGTWSTGNGSGSPNLILMNGYVDSFDNQTSTYTFDNVPFAEYSVLLYVSSDANDGRDASWTLGAQTFFINDDTAPGNDGTFTLITATTANGPGSSGNYIQFDGLTGSTVTFTGTSLSFRNFLNGVQIVATPEPGTWAAGAGLLLLAGGWVARRRGRPAA